MYISEIQHNIEEAFGVEVAETTISQSLYCHGYSCKKVRSSGPCATGYRSSLHSRLLALEPSTMKNYAISFKQLLVNSTHLKLMSMSMNLHVIVTHQIVTKLGLLLLTGPNDMTFSSMEPGK